MIAASSFINEIESLHHVSLYLKQKVAYVLSFLQRTNLCVKANHKKCCEEQDGPDFRRRKKGQSHGIYSKNQPWSCQKNFGDNCNTKQQIRARTRTSALIWPELPDEYSTHFAFRKGVDGRSTFT